MEFARITPPKAPSAWLDLDALDQNIALVNQKTQAVNLRLATKSIRSIDVLKYIQAKSPHYIGLMSYAADESVYLLENGFDNILCAYPTLDMESVAQTFEYVDKGATMIWMADRIEQLEHLNRTGKEHNTKVDVCLDINMSMPLPKLYFGTKRSALMSKSEVKKLLKQAKLLKYINICAAMGYEAQIAGLPERLPNKTMLAPAIRMLKQRSTKQLSRRRSGIVEWLNKQGYTLKLVNGGGSGSMDFTSCQPEVTEITVGSAYYKPAYFDYMDTMSEFVPAAGFVLPVTRQPEKKVVTCHSGGFIASGAVGADKAPVVAYPPELSIIPDEGFGEVQTPLQGRKAAMLKIGDYVWFRHAKAGELCEHFNELYCYRQSKLVNDMSKELTALTNLANAKKMKGTQGSVSVSAPSTITTYRGEGKCFH